MKALLLNSGMGSRMGVLTSDNPKCMTEVSGNETILGRQLKQLSDMGINDIVITTGMYDSVIANYCSNLELPINITYVNNPEYQNTNYIYSIYCAREYLNDDILLIHGDLIFENAVIDEIINCDSSCVVVSSTNQLPEKDFKAVIRNGVVDKIGIEYFNDAMALQPFYKLNHKDWKIWLDNITKFCEKGNVKCYAENAFNEVSDKCRIIPLDIKGMLCGEIDTPHDLAVISNELKRVETRTVYMCFSTDIIHSGHMSIIKKAQRFGKLIIGVLTDEAVASYKRFPLVPFDERKTMFKNIVGVYKVVEQESLSYTDNLIKYRPTYVVHGDDWITGFQRFVRDEVTSCLASYGGQLVEFPYSSDEKYKELESRTRAELSLPDVRRARLRKIISMKGLITAMEAHSGITGLIVEKTVIHKDGNTRQFDALWISSLCDSTAKGKPDIELIDMTSRFRTIDDIAEVTTKPIIFDGDTGGMTEHFVYTVRTLERMGVSMIIIEDKIGLKRNSLFGNEVEQTQDSIENFSSKIRAGKKAQKSKDFMICARIESLILEKGTKDALQRANAYVDAGADAVMIHSRNKEPREVFEFIDEFRTKNNKTPIVVVPTSFNTVTEDELKEHGVNLVIYANQFTRAGFPAMQNVAKLILENQRAKECDDLCMPIKDIIRLVPEDI